MELKFSHTFEENRRLNLGWKPIIFVYLAYILIMSLVVPTTSKVFGWGDLPSVLLAYSISAIVCLSLIFKLGRTPVSLGLAQEGFLKKWLVGWTFAILSLGFVFLTNILFSGLSFVYNKQFAPLLFLLLLIGFAVQSFMEEFLLRALIQNQITMKFGVLIGILGNALIFAIGHATNPGATILSIVNTFLLGVAFSLMYYYHDNLWLVAGFHASWNFILGPVLGIAVSGFDLPTTLLKTSLNMNKVYLNGGQYGFEASYPVALVSVIIILIYVSLLRKRESKVV
mgnify:CR=1 FL=1